MIHAAPIPPDEHARLVALRRLLVLDSEPEAVFDSIAQMAARICGTPIALMSLIDDHRQWFKANVGLHGVSETPREIAFCAHAILDDKVFTVPDATQDDRFAANPLVAGAPDIRLYAGAPLIVDDGKRIGTLCVIDRQPRQLDATQLAMLESLAAVASNALIMRRDLIDKSLSIRSDHERALSHSESHYRAVVEDQAEFISLADPDGVLTYVNPAYARLFDRTPADMAGRSLFDFVALDDRAAVADLLRDVAQTGRSASTENRMVLPDGVHRWVAWTNGVSRDSRGRALLHSVGRDVSDRKRAEAELRSSQAFLYRTGRVAGVGGWEVDLVCGAVNWSDETRRLHDVPPEFVPTLETAIAFYEQDARLTIQGAVQTAIEQGTSWDLELPLVTAIGRSIWVRVVGEVEYESGAPVRLVGAFQDVTQRKQLEHDVAAQTATLGLVTEAIPATVAVVDQTGRYRFVNGAFERGCGRTRAQILGRPVRDILGPEEFARRWPWIKSAFAGESVVFELAYPSSEGSKHVSFNYVPLRLASGEVDGFVVVSQDVTSQKLEAMRLRELSQRDSLTGLLNRAGFENYLERTVLDGGGPSLALLYVDLDGFKAVNDIHGHPAGDRVLREFAQRLLHLVRPTDAVARLGGDEFAIALAGIRHHADARTVADKIIVAAKAPFEINGVVVRIGASVGVAFNADAESGWADLLERADAKLLSAESGGQGSAARNRCVTVSRLPV